MRKVCCWGCWLLLGWMMLAAGCGDYLTLFVNQSASLGGGADAITLGQAGASGSPRGIIRVLFINNTPFRAVFSGGAYDQASRHSSIDLVQFGALDSEDNLEGNTSSAIGSLNCARQVGIGDDDLIRLMTDDFNVQQQLASAIVPGVKFIEVMEDGTQVDRGSAPERVIHIGTDFRCESLLIFRFEIDDSGVAPFRVDYEVVPAGTTRS